MQTLHGKVALVTGASRGVGRGIARELADAGVKLYVTGRSEQDLRHMDGRGMAIRCDHRVDPEVERAFTGFWRTPAESMYWLTMSGAVTSRWSKTASSRG
jgi:NAD(P)-dependent dehydrogenase (short-subunit alcohol dehydrogenase family)